MIMMIMMMMFMKIMTTMVMMMTRVGLKLHGDFRRGGMVAFNLILINLRREKMNGIRTSSQASKLR